MFEYVIKNIVIGFLIAILLAVSFVSLKFYTETTMKQRTVLEIYKLYNKKQHGDDQTKKMYEALIETTISEVEKKSHYKGENQ